MDDLILTLAQAEAFATALAAVNNVCFGRLTFKTEFEGGGKTIRFSVGRRVAIEELTPSSVRDETYPTQADFCAAYGV